MRWPERERLAAADRAGRSQPLRSRYRGVRTARNVPFRHTNIQRRRPAPGIRTGSSAKACSAIRTACFIVGRQACGAHEWRLATRADATSGRPSLALRSTRWREAPGGTPSLGGHTRRGELVTRRNLPDRVSAGKRFSRSEHETGDTLWLAQPRFGGTQRLTILKRVPYALCDSIPRSGPARRPRRRAPQIGPPSWPGAAPPARFIHFRARKGHGFPADARKS